MKKANLAVAAIIALLLGGWFVDDVQAGDVVGRNTSAAGVDLSGLDRDQAIAALESSPFGDTVVALAHDGSEAEVTVADLGLSLDAEATADAALTKPAIFTRPFVWARSLISTRTLDAVIAADDDTIAELFTSNEDVLALATSSPEIDLIDGQFVIAVTDDSTVADLSQLQADVLAAVQSGNGDSISIDVPLTSASVDTELADQIIEEANELVDGGIAIHLVGEPQSHYLPEQSLRQWVTFAPTGSADPFLLDVEAAITSMKSLFDDLAEPTEEAGFAIDDDGTVMIIGNAANANCCDETTANEVWAAVLDGQDSVDVYPTGDNRERGIEWAESLGIVEVIGEFTSEFTPGQTRVTNIRRIAEITQGAIIEPGGEFSINDFVGVRTRENGFVGAGVISNGVFSESVGGGISQYATTLFNAAFFAGLDYGEYQSHSIYISRYPYGREATVSHPAPDLEILNTTPYGVLIWSTSTESSVTVQLFSTKWVSGEQTGQTRQGQGAACTRVTTERTRTYVEDGRTEVDSVIAVYRPEGIRCDGSLSDPAARAAAAAAAAEAEAKAEAEAEKEQQDNNGGDNDPPADDDPPADGDPPADD